MKHLLIAITVMLGLGWGGQAVAVEGKSGVSAEDVKKETKEALGAAKELTVQQKEEFQKKMRDELDRIQREIDRLVFKANQAKKETRAELDKAIGELQKKKDATAKKLQDLESASGKAWGDLKSGLNASMEELEKSYTRAKSRFP
jgi:chromosome segregation ATPase